MEKRYSARRVCRWCQEELSLTAYFRHLNDFQGIVYPSTKPEREYPGQVPVQSICDAEERGSSSDSSFSLMAECKDLDSSFCFSDCERTESGVTKSADEDTLQVEEMIEENLSSDQDSSTSDEDEIWEEYSYESDVKTSPQDDKPRSVVVGICLFLNFFQLFYKVSERAILALISFFKLLSSFLSNLVSSNILNEVVAFLLSSLPSIRRVL